MSDGWKQWVVGREEGVGLIIYRGGSAEFTLALGGRGCGWMDNVEGSQLHQADRHSAGVYVILRRKAAFSDL